VARLKVYGRVVKDWSAVKEEEEPDLAAAENGGRAILCNDMFFSHMENLLMPGRGVNMGDGWETKRNRTPGNKDWVIVQLAHPGIINRIVIDTAHFKGNFPESCMIEGCLVTPGHTVDFEKDLVNWMVILPREQLQADLEHFFVATGGLQQPFSHVRLTIFPDGGISRMRLFGKPFG